MKKILLLALLSLVVITTSSCEKKEVLKVGATAVPHAEILKQVQPILLEEGYDFEIVVYTDYVLPNLSLYSGDIIANFFQHVPYLDAQIKDNGYDFQNVGGVHVEPIGLYSKEYNTLEELPGAIELIISNSPVDRPRLFGVLEENGLISINTTTTDEDIISSSLRNLNSLFTSSKTITFIEVDSALLFTNYNNESGDVVLINGNYALDNGLNPLEDAIALEGSASLYVNILVCNTVDIDDPFIIALKKALQSTEIQEWIENNYGGAVVPAA
ncbi:Methionine-binding lipoprotein MetQ precursor [Candidatus Izimaplasma bacterium HR1]|jgi:D-methionine transport system substrate-binding protein|uniref:MetQ/NlpA family ABC transporter substrate-binding protein n=1 Tax=Candidatus Izimoplasma sp. HR1 TaxID=1541959 RepID=UPI0004F8A0D2|nr:Methionine-binding lipoprotein MetQ precursor [Candidatus Izimaplasma bacterium HR1]